jgi:DivIVA domain-containing protein
MMPSVERLVGELEARGRSLRSARGLGYRREGVDAFLRRAIAALRAAIAEDEALRTGSTSVADRWGEPDATIDVEGAVFGTARFRRAYDMRSVDELLDEIGDVLTALARDRQARRQAARPDDGGPTLR